MEQTSMTALVSAFARAYHAARPGDKVFDDTAARRLLSEEEYRTIAESMTEGIGFFCPGFRGDGEAALDWIVRHQLGPSPLGRAAFAEGELERACARGVRRYLLLGAGLDSFAYRQPAWAAGLEIIEADRPQMLEDKRRRLAASGMAVPGNVRYAAVDFTDPAWPDALRDGTRPLSFVSALGLSYYLPREDFRALLGHLPDLCAPGSRLALDYPCPEEDAVSRRQRDLAGGAGEAMQAAYTPAQMAEMLACAGFAPLEDLSPEEITARYFAPHDRPAPEEPMRALPGVRYLLAEMTKEK